MNQSEFISFLESEGYFNIRFIEGRGFCGLMFFAFTVGVVYGLNTISYKGRYCFNNLKEAKDAFMLWDGNGDICGNWIKHKGEIEYSNPNL